MKNFNMAGFRLICQSDTEDLFEYLSNQMEKLYGDENCVIDNDWLYCNGDIPVCLCAHLDTVHKELPLQIYLEPEYNIITSPQGIGGDDRCGVYIILSILKEFEKIGALPSIFFSTDEETGSKTTIAASKYLKENNPEMIDRLCFFVQLDRKNYVDAVYYQCGNKEFKEYINSYGFQEAFGTRTDISILCRDFDKAGVNFSCGFQNEHHLDEYVLIDVMDSTHEKLTKILKELDTNKKFKHKALTTLYSKDKSYSKPNDIYKNDSFMF